MGGVDLIVPRLGGCPAIDWHRPCFLGHSVAQEGTVSLEKKTEWGGGRGGEGVTITVQCLRGTGGVRIGLERRGERFPHHRTAEKVLVRSVLRNTISRESAKEGEELLHL